MYSEATACRLQAREMSAGFQETMCWEALTWTLTTLAQYISSEVIAGVAA